MVAISHYGTLKERERIIIVKINAKNYKRFAETSRSIPNASSVRRLIRIFEKTGSVLNATPHV